LTHSFGFKKLKLSTKRAENQHYKRENNAMKTAFLRREQRPFTQGAKQRLETILGLSMWFYSQLTPTFQHQKIGAF